jgi:DNA-binding GntR family transcriptional regulator
MSDAPLLTKSVYDDLRRAIVLGEYRPGERLIEAELAAKLDASRTPIREALQRLSAVGLVISRRRGWVVHAFTRAEIQHVYEVRMALEGFACRLAARHAGPKDIAVLKKLVAAYGASVRSGDLGGCETANDELHDRISSLAGNPKLAASIVDSRGHYFTTRLARLYAASDLAESHRGHVRMLDAIRGHDEDAAEAAAREHLESTMRIAMKHEAL